MFGYERDLIRLGLVIQNETDGSDLLIIIATLRCSWSIGVGDKQAPFRHSHDGDLEKSQLIEFVGSW
jgi:hypothetical protein